MLTIVTRFIARLLSRPSAAKAVLWSIGLHSTAIAVVYALWLSPMALSPFSRTVVFDGNRHVVEIEASFSELPSEQEIETVLELEPDFLPLNEHELPPLEYELTVAPPTLLWPSQSPQPEVRVSAPDVEKQFAGVEEIVPPDFTGNPPPRYPAEAIRKRLEGTVLLRVHLRALGDVELVEIVQSSGHTILDRSAVEAVGKWHARPAKQGDASVSTIEILPIRFRL